MWTFFFYILLNVPGLIMLDPSVHSVKKNVFTYLKITFLLYDPVELQLVLKN